MFDREIFEKKKNDFEKGRIFATSFNIEEANELIRMYQQEIERNKKDLEETNISIADLKNKIGNIEDNIE